MSKTFDELRREYELACVAVVEADDAWHEAKGVSGHPYGCRCAPCIAAEPRVKEAFSAMLEARAKARQLGEEWRRVPLSVGSAS